MELIFIKFVTFIRKVFSFIKLHWQSLVLIIGFIFTFIFIRDKQKLVSDLVKQREELIKKHREELDNLQKSVEENIKKRQEIEKQYNDLMEKIKKDFDDGTIRIGEQKKKEILEIIRANQNNPAASAESINRIFGIRVVEIKEIP